MLKSPFCRFSQLRRYYYGMSTTRHYDAIFIGSGQATNPLGVAFAKAGFNACIIESVHVGGTCVNEGCTPTKTMVASARVAYLAKRASHYGIQFHNPKFVVDMSRVRQRKRDIVNSFRGGNEKRIENQEGLDLLMGKARFIGKRKVEVTHSGGNGTSTIEADKIFINVGCRPIVPPIPGLESVNFLNSTSIMELDVVPEHLIVLGAGYIALEFGQMFHRFGSKVTIIGRSAHVLGREDVDISEEVEKILSEDGIELLLNTKTVSAKQENERISIVISEAGKERTVVGSHLLVATGRSPNTENLNLEAAGIDVDKHGFIIANARCESKSAENVWILGDCKGGPQFTHISYDDFRIVRNNILNQITKEPTVGSIDNQDRLVPYTVFIDPQLGRVGITEAEAIKNKIPHKVAKIPMSYVARALETDESRGIIKAIVHAETDKIIGAAALGIEGGEIMSMLQIAMMGDVKAAQLREGVFSHPNLSEGLNTLFSTIQ